MQGLGSAVKKGAAWILTGRFLTLIINFGANVVLARLLEPEDFGVFGIALIVKGLATRLGNVGFGMALVQKKEIGPDHISSLFVINLYIFGGMAALLIYASPHIGSFLESPLAGRVSTVMALVFLTSPFSSVANAILQRRMDFKGTSIGNTVDHFVSSGSAILLALQGYGVWSLACGYLLGSASNTLILCKYAKWMPSLRFNGEAMRELSGFGFKVFIKDLLVFGSDKVDYFIIAKRLGVAPLGFYEKAFNLMELASKELSQKLSVILFPAFSKLQDDNIRLRAAYSKVILILSLVCFPFFFGLFLVAPSFVGFFFGEKWLPTVLPLKILCIAGLFRIHLQVTSTAVNATGFVGSEIRKRAVSLILLSIGCWVGSAWGASGVALAVTVVTGLLAVQMAAYFKNLVGLHLRDLFAPQWQGFLASLAMLVAVLGYQAWVKSTLNLYSPTVLFSSVFIGATTYLLTVWVIRTDQVVSLFREFTNDMKPLFQKPGH
ncbi:MAG: lipopolysaccharide biosynthesis protein [Nitrospiria bacterium]